jgi:peptidoglycan/LPS O-acetylase OafA/YrhL
MQTTVVQPRLPALTSLRFLAALHVVMFHLHALKIYEGSGWYHRTALIGYVGVSLFYVLSGFILVYTYGGREMHVGKFWRARFARVYPAYLFSLLLTAPGFFYVCIALKNIDIPIWTWCKNHLLAAAALVPTLLQSWVPGAALGWNPPAWSLSDEAFFYLLFPLIVGWLVGSRNRKLVMYILIFWAMSLAFTSAYVLLRPDGVAFTNDDSALTWLNVLKFNPLLRLPEFLMGACCGFLFLRKPVDRKWGTPLVLVGLLAFAAVVGLSPHIPYPILHDSLLAPAFAAIIYGLALRPRWSAVLEISPLVLLGEASYSLYLLHSFILSVYFMPMGVLRQMSPLKFAIGIALPIVVSVVAYKLLEQPARNWLRPKGTQPTEATPVAMAV